MDALLGSSNPYLSVVRPWKEVHCAAFEPPTSAALSSPIVWQRTGKHCQANTPELAQGTIAILPCVHCRLPAAFLKALLSPIPRKDRQSGGPGRSGLSQAHIFFNRFEHLQNLEEQDQYSWQFFISPLRFFPLSVLDHLLRSVCFWELSPSSSVPGFQKMM